MRHLKAGRLASRLRQGGFIGLGVVGSGPAFGGGSNSPAAGVRSLFANGEAGAIFIAQKPAEWGANPDLVTMYQDSAGTTPVTALEQPVGLHLDTRPIFKFPGGAPNPAPNAVGQVLRQELAPATMAAANFAAGGVGAALSNPTGSQLTITNGSAAEASANLTASTVIGVFYEVVLTLVSKVGGGSGFVVIGASNMALGGVPGTYRKIIQVTSVGTIRIAVGTTNLNDAITVSGFSCKAVYGNHRSQSSAGARGTLSARYNKVTARNANPVDLTNLGLINATNGLATLTVVNDAAALAAASLDKICTLGKVYKLDNTLGDTAAHANVAAAAGNLNTHFVTAWIRGSGQGRIAISNAAPAYANLPAGFTKTQVSLTPLAVGDVFRASAQPGAIIYFILPDFREACYSYLPTPQLITGTGATAADYDDTGFPARIKYSGAQGYATGAVDFSGSGLAQVIGGLAKLKDDAANPQIYTELGPDGVGAGSFNLQVPAAAALLRGRASGFLLDSGNIAAPTAAVVSYTLDLNAPSQAIRINAAVSASQSIALGGGTCLNSALNYGSRNNTGTTAGTLNATYDEFVSIVRGGTLAANDPRIAQAEQFCNNLMSKVF